MSRYLGWCRELPAGVRQRRQIRKVLPEQPDQGHSLCKSGRFIPVIWIVCAERVTEPAGGVSVSALIQRVAVLRQAEWYREDLPSSLEKGRRGLFWYDGHARVLW